MSKIIIGSAGGAPTEGVIRSLQMRPDPEEIIGIGSEPTDLILSNADRKYVVPYADAPEYKQVLMGILEAERPDLIHFQHDLEIYHASVFREEIHNLGVRTYMPSHDVIDNCVHKFKSYERFRAAGVPVPTSMMINDRNDLAAAFDTLGNDEGKIWLRAASIGGGGKGALPTNDLDFAAKWISHYNGWGEFMAAEMLTRQTVTWLSIWYEGELVVGQGRIRKGWTHGNRTISGITGVTKVGQTYASEQVDEIAMNSVYAVSDRPHGIFGVDMAYDGNGIPNITEINISRFFTTIWFFTEAGLNMPGIFMDLGLHGRHPELDRKLNPLPDGLMWLRGMDTAPRLCTSKDLEQELIYPE